MGGTWRRASKRQGASDTGGGMGEQAERLVMGGTWRRASKRQGDNRRAERMEMRDGGP